SIRYITHGEPTVGMKAFIPGRRLRISVMWSLDTEAMAWIASWRSTPRRSSSTKIATFVSNTFASPCDPHALTS
ncbi:MAG TPA: hypothetical protein VGL41_12155, partial [Roseiarcus sp.]